MVLKILQSLPTRCEAKQIAIKEANNLCTLIVEKLLGFIVGLWSRQVKSKNRNKEREEHYPEIDIN